MEKPRFSGLGEGRVFKPSPLEEVTILAMGHTTLGYAQNAYSDPRYTHRDPKKHAIWAVNCMPWVWQHDVLFNMHDLKKLKVVNEKERDYLELYKNLEKPLVTIRAMEEIPKSLEYPFAEVIEATQQGYFANGVSYLIALALTCGVKRINIYGADYSYKDRSEYEAGRCNVEYWLGFAAARGVELAMDSSTTLMDLCYTLAGGKGQIGYGAVYGFFDEQPTFARVDNKMHCTGFNRPAQEPEGEAKAEA